MNYTDLITNYFTSNEYLKIKQYYQEPSMMEIYEKERSETCHSGFIAWVLSTPELNFGYESPFYRFLYLLLRRARQQNITLATERLAQVLISNVYSLEKLDIQREYRIYEEEYKEGYLDIFVQSRLSGKDLNIIVENKVGSSETTKRYQSKIVYQSDAYHNWLETKEKEGLNIYVFLSPVSNLDLDQMSENERHNRCHCKYYVFISYQDILDCIIQPYLEKKSNSETILSAKTRFRLEDYKKSLGKPNKNDSFNSIMAMTQEEQTMLVDFFDRNRDLILASIQAKTSDPNLDADEDQRDELNKIKDSVSKVSRPRMKFSYNGEGSYQMWEATMKFVLELSNNSVKPEDIKDILEKCAHTKLLSQSEFKEKSGDMQARFIEIELNGEMFYLQKGYAYYQTEKTRNPNFPLIIQEAEKKNIQIVPLS